MKKVIVIIAVVFFTFTALLTFFSSTIDHMLLPQVKVCFPVRSDITGNHYVEDRYLVPKASVERTGEDSGNIFLVSYSEDDDVTGTVRTEGVSILAEDDLYYEVQSYMINSMTPVVYSTSKSIENSDRVYVSEEG